MIVLHAHLCLFGDDTFLFCKVSVCWFFIYYWRSDWEAGWQILYAM